MNNVTIKHFNPFNKFEVDHSGSRYSDGYSKYVVDKTTGDRYWNEPGCVVGSKSFGLAWATPFVHTFALIAMAIFRAARTAIGYHFWKDTCGWRKVSISQRFIDFAADIFKIVMTPISLVGLELSALYGCVSPNNGRKLYASFERVAYGNFIIAPCFQPSPKRHLLGGNANERGAW